MVCLSSNLCTVIRYTRAGKDGSGKRLPCSYITHTANATLINPKVPQPIIDYPHETARTILDLIMSNTVRRHPHCRIIVSHAGGTFPYIAMRAAHRCRTAVLAPSPRSEEST